MMTDNQVFGMDLNGLKTRGSERIHDQQKKGLKKQQKNSMMLGLFIGVHEARQTR